MSGPNVDLDIPMRRDLRRFLAQIPCSLVLADPNREDCPIVYVNETFEAVTGYRASDVLGRNCRFLQGEDVAQSERGAIREAIGRGEPVTVDIRNYRACGDPFTNRLSIFPIRDDADRVAVLVGLQTEVGTAPEKPALTAQAASELLRETQHRVKNHLCMVASLIRLESRQPRGGGAADFDDLARRVDALSLLYDVFYDTGLQVEDERAALPVGRYVSRIAETIGALDGRDAVTLTVDVDDVDMFPRLAANLGLIVSEVLSNTYQHAFPGRLAGKVQVSLKRRAHGAVRLAVRDDGVGLGKSDWPSGGNLGGRLILSLAQGCGARLSVESGDWGTAVRIDLDGSGPSDTPPHLASD